MTIEDMSDEDLSTYIAKMSRFVDALHWGDLADLRLATMDGGSDRVLDRNMERTMRAEKQLKLAKDEKKKRDARR